MHDVRFIRENPDVIRESLRRRGADIKLVDDAIETDRSWRAHQKNLETLRMERNTLITEITALKKSGGDISALRKRMAEVNANIKTMESEAESLLVKRDALLKKLPNLLDADVPDGASEDDNVPVKFWGTARVLAENKSKFRQWTLGRMDYTLIEKRPESHVDILTDSGSLDTLRAAKIAGSRFYYMKKNLPLLDLALQMYTMEFLLKKGYTPVIPPYMMNSKMYDGVIDFDTFEEMIYRVENEDLYLIATAEHPIAAMFAGEILDDPEMPMRFAGVSPCFRKEAGAHGRDTKGIFRVHQFHKVEQFVFARPGDETQILDELLSNAEELYRSLGLPYRVVNVCTGELGFFARKKYDMEVWMPAQQSFREVVSASNVGDFQTRRLKMRVREHGEKYYPFTLNSTALATTRTIVAIVENFQDNGKIHIPDVLHKYLSIESL